MADARLLAMSPAAIAAIDAAIAALSGAPPNAPTAGVWPSNVATVTAWLYVASQWRTASMSSGGRLRPFYVGLDYGGARVALEARGVTITPQLWDALTVMEMEARDALNGLSTGSPSTGSG